MFLAASKARKFPVILLRSPETDKVCSEFDACAAAMASEVKSALARCNQCAAWSVATSFYSFIDYCNVLWESAMKRRSVVATSHRRRASNFRWGIRCNVVDADVMMSTGTDVVDAVILVRVAIWWRRSDAQHLVRLRWIAASSFRTLTMHLSIYRFVMLRSTSVALWRSLPPQLRQRWTFVWLTSISSVQSDSQHSTASVRGNKNAILNEASSDCEESDWLQNCVFSSWNRESLEMRSSLFVCNIIALFLL
jgi:hypothetical protein